MTVTHLISHESREESEVYCDDGRSLTESFYPRTKTIGEVTCRQCLDLARTEGFALANACDARRRSLEHPTD